MLQFSTFTLPLIHSKIEDVQITLSSFIEPLTLAIFNFDSSKSDGKITMPTLQRNPQTGERFYELNGRAYNLDGTVSVSGQKVIDAEKEKFERELDNKIKKHF